DRDVGGLKLGQVADHLGDIGEDARSGAQQLLGLVGEQVGLLRLQVAGGDQLHVALRRAVECSHAAQVAAAHAAAADGGVRDPRRHADSLTLAGIPEAAGIITPPLGVLTFPSLLPGAKSERPHPQPLLHSARDPSTALHPRVIATETRTPGHLGPPLALDGGGGRSGEQFRLDPFASGLWRDAAYDTVRGIARRSGLTFRLTINVGRPSPDATATALLRLLVDW